MKKPFFAFFLLMPFIALAIGACATVPPQTRPTNPDAFAGTWEGSWHNVIRGTSGPVEMTIEPPGGDGLVPAEFQYWFEGKPSAVFRGKWKFDNGVLVLVSHDPVCFTKLLITLHGDGNTQRHEWTNNCTNAAGWSSLTRKK